MKITRIEPIVAAGPKTDLCFVRVFTDEPGLEGIGEGSLPAKCTAVANAVSELGDLVEGMDPMRIEHVWQRMYRHSYWRGGPVLTSAISGIDMALWDIKGKALGQPVCNLLGGPVRDEVKIYANIGLTCDPAEVRDRIAAALELGYDTVKFYPFPHVGPLMTASELNITQRCAEAARDALGPDRDFALDLHGRCGVGSVIALEQRLRETAPIWLEEPVLPENIAGLEACAGTFATPIASGERWFTRWDYVEPLEKRAVHILQPDVANAGGISELARIASMAETYGAAFCPHNPNGPVQGKASVHLAAAMPAFSILEHRFDCEADFAKITDHPPTNDGSGKLPVPGLPGLGISIEPDRIARGPLNYTLHESYRPDGSIGDW